MLTVADYFCGAGGSSTGMEKVPGVRAVMAANHWRLAVDTHNANLPHADHDIADISGMDPRRHPKTDIGWFSPECTWWSIAKGIPCDYDGRPVQLDLFGTDDDKPLPDEAGQRSRMLMQDVPRFTDVHRYRAVLVENVTDILKWAHLDAWLTRMRLLGYQHRTIVLNSAFAAVLGDGAPQLRDRVYFVFWRDTYPTPDFGKWTRPRAWCPTCGTDVRAVYTPKPGPPRAMRYGQQYTYRCPSPGCRGSVAHPYALPAADAIDWTLAGQRIGDRTRPLQPKTLARIADGLRRHTQPPLLLPIEGRDGKQARTASLPLRAQTGRAQDALVVPLRNHGVARPAAAHPLVTFAAGGTHQGLLYGYDTGALRPVQVPMPAQTAVAGDALLGPAPDVDACTFRMLAVDEIRAGMAFTPGYQLFGSKRERVRMLGNAVTPPAARDLVAAVTEAITGAQIEVAA